MRPGRFQFGIRRLFVLTFAVAVVVMISKSVFLPRFAQGLIAIYLLCLVGWAVMRGPTVYADLLELHRLRCKIKERRHKLEGEALKMKRLSRGAKSVDDSDCR